MAEDRNEANESDEQPPVRLAEQDPELWDWARAAGVSREDLLRALELSRRS